MDQLKFEVALPPVPAQVKDVVRGELTVAVAGGEPFLVVLDKDQVNAAEPVARDPRLVGAEGASVGLEYRFVDNGENASAASAVNVTLVDIRAWDTMGEISVLLINHDPSQPIDIKRGDRIAQLIVQKVERASFVETADLPDSSRGAGGFGSSGGHSSIG